MGAAQQKDATAYFTRALTGATPPDPLAFIAKVKQFNPTWCSGSELSGVCAPVAAALVSAAISGVTPAATPNTTPAPATAAHASPPSPHGQLRWLLQLCSRLLHGVVDNPNEAVDPATPAVVHLTELLLRHVLHLTRGNSVLLVGILESGGDAHAGASAAGDHTKPAASAMSAAPPPPRHAMASSPPANAVQEDAAALLCRTGMSVLLRLPLALPTVLLHLEVLRLLLTMTSSALHHGTEFREDTMDLFTELMMSAPQLNDFLAELLRIVVGWGKSEWETQAPLLYHEGCQPSMRNFFQVFSTAGSSGGGSGGGGAGGSKRQSAPYVLEVDTSTVVYVNPSNHPGGSHLSTVLGVSSTGNTSGGGGAGSGSASTSVATMPKDPAGILLNSCSCWEQLGRHAAALLSVLVVHQKGGGRNPALEYVVSLQDGTPVSFVRLLSAIRWKLTRYPDLSILLYVLLHDHHEFLHTVLSEDAALLVSTVQQLLELTYRTCKDASRPVPAGAVIAGSSSSSSSSLDVLSSRAGEDVLQTAVLGRLLYQLRIFSYPFINFMSSTLLLLISQDCVVNRLLCNTPCLPGHLLERYDVNAPVGALAVVVLALGITKGFNERNEALIAVFAPCLVNLAPFVHDMDAYTAQRVSGLLTLVLKKMHRASALLKAAAVAAERATASASETGSNNEAGAAAAAAAAAGDGTESLKRSLSSSHVSVVASAEEAQALEEIVAMYARQLRTIVEGIEALLRGPNRHNEHLVYELLYARSKIIDEVEAAVAAGYLFAVPTKQVLMNLTEMIKNCEADIASSDQAQSPQEIIAILRRGQRQGSGYADGADGEEMTSRNNINNNNGSGIGSNNATGSGGGEGAGPGAGEGEAVSSVHVSRSPGPDGTMSDGPSIDLVYSYEESPHSYDFFGPFVWSILLSAARAPGSALWCHRSSELTLFPH